MINFKHYFSHLSKRFFKDIYLLNYFKIVSFFEGVNINGWFWLRFKNDFFYLNVSKENLFIYKLRLKFFIKNVFSYNKFYTLQRLNIEIINWTLLYVFCDSISSIFNFLDRYIYNLLWCVLIRINPRRSHKWIYNKYWKFLNGFWTFFLFDLNSLSSIFMKLHSYYFFRHKFYYPFSSLDVFYSWNEYKLNSVMLKRSDYFFFSLYYFLIKKQFCFCFSCGRLFDKLDVKNLRIVQVKSLLIVKQLRYYKFSNFILLHNGCFKSSI